MKKMFFVFTMALSAFTGCLVDSGSNGGDDGGNSTGSTIATDYVPLVVGNQWSYDTTTTSTGGYNNSETYTMAVTGTTTLNGMTYWVLDTSNESEDTYMRVDSATNIAYLYQDMSFGKRVAGKAARIKAISAAQDMAMFNFGKKSGQTWAIYSDTMTEQYYTLTVSMNGRHGGTESITTPAGTYSNCVKFIITTTGTSTSQGQSFTWTNTMTMWFAKNVGPVKVLSQDVEPDWTSTTTDLLTSFSTSSGGTPSYSVSGQINTSTGEGLSGVSVALTGGSINLISTTGSSGSYTFTNVPNGTYTVNPSKTGYTFNPTSQQVTVNGQNASVSTIIGTATGGSTAQYDVSGKVLDERGVALEFVYVTLQDTMSSLNAYTIVTDEEGNYSFDDITASTYTLSYSYWGYDFPEKSVTYSGTNITVAAVSGTPTADNHYFKVSGRVVNSSGAGVSGIRITLSGSTAGPLVETTDSSGNYEFTYIDNGSYTLTPEQLNYTFAPQSINITISGGGIVAANIVATYSAQ